MAIIKVKHKALLKGKSKNGRGKLKKRGLNNNSYTSI